MSADNELTQIYVMTIYKPIYTKSLGTSALAGQQVLVEHGTV